MSSSDGRKRQAASACSQRFATNEDRRADDLPSLPGSDTHDIQDDGSSAKKTKLQTRRRPYQTKQRREEVAQVRRIGACSECRARKVKCVHALQKPDAPPVPNLTPKPLSQPNTFGFEVQLPELSSSSTSYGSTSLKDGAEPSVLYVAQSCRYIDNVDPYPGTALPDGTLCFKSNDTQSQNYSLNYWPRSNTPVPNLGRRWNFSDLLKDIPQKVSLNLSDWAQNEPRITTNGSCGDYQLFPSTSMLSGPYSNQTSGSDIKIEMSKIPSNQANMPEGGASDSNRSPTSSQTIAATDSSIDVETSSAASDMETDWDEGENGRDSVYTEICKSNRGKRLKISHVRQLRRQRLLKEPQKQRQIDVLMGEFYTIFKRAKTDFRTCTGGHNSSSQGSVQGTAPTKTRSPAPAAGTKHRLNDGRGHHGEEEEEENHAPKRSNHLSKSPDDKLPGLKFACPYHQHNPRKYGIGAASCAANYRSCAGPGWISVARIKEHLYRRHRNPIRCSRCSTVFKTQGSLSTHLRIPVPCVIQPEEPMEGVTDDIEKKLKSRKKTSPDQSEEDRWRAVYNILFPDEEIPSPYYERDSNVAAFEEYSRRETPLVFLRMLENRASTNQLTAEIRDDLLDILQECRIYIYRRYHQETTRNIPAALDKNTQSNAVPPSLPSNDSQSDHAHPEVLVPHQAGIDDPLEYDPDLLESIFQNEFQATLDSGSYDYSYASAPPSQRQCYCQRACSCLLS